VVRKLSPWCKKVKCELIKRDMTIDELAMKAGFSREYVSAILNGRVVSENGINKISDTLNISNDYYNCKI